LFPICNSTTYEKFFYTFFQYHACIYTPTYSINKPISKRYIDNAPNSNPTALEVLIQRKVSSKLYYDLKEWKDFSMRCCINNILDPNFPWSFHKHRSHFSSPNNSTLKNTTQKLSSVLNLRWRKPLDHLLNSLEVIIASTCTSTLKHLGNYSSILSYFSKCNKIFQKIRCTTIKLC
jgi:hypothetical protein